MVVAFVFVLACQAPAARPSTVRGWDEAGFSALRRGNAAEAADDFNEALRVKGDDTLALLGAGAAANVLGHTDDARLQLTRALQADPSLTAASLLLGEVLYGDGDLQGAINVYTDALTHAPADTRVAARLDQWKHEAAVQDAFSSRIAAHFTILFEGPPDSALAAHLSTLLEAIYWQVGGALQAYPSNVLTVVLYSKEQFRDVTQSPSWAGGMYDGRIRVPVAGQIDEKELRRVLTHEFTHAVVHSLAPRGVPVWLNEGLAVLMERGGAAAPAPAADSMPLGALEGSFEQLSPAQARSAYATSAAAVQALLDRAGPMVIVNLLTNLGNGLSFDKAFSRAALMSYSEFQRSWK